MSAPIATTAPPALKALNAPNATAVARIARNDHIAGIHVTACQGDL